MTTRSSGVFSGYDANSYDDGALDFHLAVRPVFKDYLTAKDKADVLIAADGKDTMPIIMRDLGYSQEDIDVVMVTTAQRTADAVRGMAEAAFGANEKDLQTNSSALDEEDDAMEDDDGEGT